MEMLEMFEESGIYIYQVEVKSTPKKRKRQGWYNFSK